MPEGVQTLDGKPVEIPESDREFARAMAAPVEDVAAPPKRPQTGPGATESAAKPRRGRPPKAEKPRVTDAPVKAAPDADKSRHDGITGLVQMGAGLCLVADMRTPDTNIAWRADAITLANAAKPLADACVDVARSNAGFAKVLDRVTQVGPYGALITAVLGVAGQLAYNHGMPVGAALGARDPELLVASVVAADDNPAQ